MDRIFQIPGRRLIRIDQALRIRFQVDLDFTLRGYVARLLIVFKVVPINLIEAAGIASVEGDRYVVQFGTAAGLELDSLARLDPEQRSTLFGL